MLDDPVAGTPCRVIARLIHLAPLGAGHLVADARAVPIVEDREASQGRPTVDGGCSLRRFPDLTPLHQKRLPDELEKAAKGIVD